MIIHLYCCGGALHLHLHVQDNVFVQLLCSIHYRVIKENADDAFYELQNPQEQIQAYVFDGIPTLTVSDNINQYIMYHPWMCFYFLLFAQFLINELIIPFSLFMVHVLVTRALVPRMTLDELFEQKGEVAKAVLEELEKVTNLVLLLLYKHDIILAHHQNRRVHGVDYHDRILISHTKSCIRLCLCLYMHTTCFIGPVLMYYAISGDFCIYGICCIHMILWGVSLFNHQMGIFIMRHLKKEIKIREELSLIYI